MKITPNLIKQLARQSGFELAGVAAAVPVEDGANYQAWVDRGMAGKMGYLTDHRAAIRLDPKQLLASARSVVCVGKVYNTNFKSTVATSCGEAGWISRYAWGDDYHSWMRTALKQLADELQALGPLEYRICVDTAPILERSYARLAGLGWIGRNTCLIHQMAGSWLYLGELLISVDVEPDVPPPDRCGTCRRCIDACPTGALVSQNGRWELDSRLCISYFTIELRDSIPEPRRNAMGAHVFGCDICQDVCPWNRKAAVTEEPAFQAVNAEPPLEKMAGLSEAEFREMFRTSAVSRARYAGFLRNVAVAMGNSGLEKFRDPLERLANSPIPIVAEHARWGLGRLAASRQES